MNATDFAPGPSTEHSTWVDTLPSTRTFEVAAAYTSATELKSSSLLPRVVTCTVSERCQSNVCVSSSQRYDLHAASLCWNCASQLSGQTITSSTESPYRAHILDLLSRVPAARLLTNKNRTKTKEEAEAFFWSHVHIGAPSECWLWSGSTTPVGNRHGDVYGQTSLNGKFYRAHRCAYTFTKGAIPDSLVVCHNCDVFLCCNPDHLRVDSSQGNVRDAVERGRIPRGEDSTFRRHPELIPRGEASGAATLTALEVIVMRWFYYWGWASARLLARYFGISEVQALLIIKCESWAHIQSHLDITPELKSELADFYQHQACHKRKGERLIRVRADEIRSLVKKGVKQADIARSLSVDPSHVSRIARGQAWQDIADEHYNYDCEALPLIEITERTKNSARGNRHGTHTRPETVPRGEHHGNSIFTELDVVRIRRTVDANRDISGLIGMIATYLHCDDSAVWSIAHRKTWQHVAETALPEVKAIPLETLHQYAINRKVSHGCRDVRVTDQQARNMLLIYRQANGRRGIVAELARRYGVSPKLILNIVTGKSRKHLLEECDNIAANAAMLSSENKEVGQLAMHHSAIEGVHS